MNVSRVFANPASVNACETANKPKAIPMKRDTLGIAVALKYAESFLICCLNRITSALLLKNAQMPKIKITVVKTRLIVVTGNVICYVPLPLIFGEIAGSVSDHINIKNTRVCITTIEVSPRDHKPFV
jgi:hypothetical protein